MLRAHAVPPRPAPRPPVYLGPVRMPSRYFLAPLAGYTNLALRRTLRELGGLGLATTDLVNARALARGQPQDRGSDRHHAGRPAAGRADLRVGAGRPAPRRHGCSSPAASDTSTSTWAARSTRSTKSGGGSAMMCDTTGADRRPGARRRRGGAGPGDGEDAARLGRPAIDRPVLRPRVRAGRRGGGHDPRPHARAGLRRHGQPRRHPRASSRRSSASRSSATATCGRWPTRPGCSRTPAATPSRIGRGALLNPWFFAQLQAWEETGDPGPPPSYFERLDFMETSPPPAVRAARRAVRLPPVPQGGQLVLQGAQARPRGAAGAGDARHAGDIRPHRRRVARAGPAAGLAGRRGAEHPGAEGAD